MFLSKEGYLYLIWISFKWENAFNWFLCKFSIFLVYPIKFSICYGKITFVIGFLVQTVGSLNNVLS